MNNIDDLTIREAKQLTSMFGNQQVNEHPFQIGTAYLVRTVTHIDIGIIVGVTQQEIIMRDASWIADTGRFSNALRDGTLNEVEPYPDGQKVIIGRGSLIDATVWNHPLPREQK